jgi:hypothetical protein
MQTVEEKITRNEVRNVVMVEREVKQKLFDINRELPSLEEIVFSHVSYEFLEKNRYFNSDGNIRLYYFVDLLLQAREIVKECCQYQDKKEIAFMDDIDVPEGKKAIVFITSNEDGKLTIKSPNEV